VICGGSDFGEPITPHMTPDADPHPEIHLFDRVQDEIGSRRNWTDDNGPDIMLKAADKDEFEMALHKALYAEVNSWQVSGGAARNVDCALPWERVFPVERSGRSPEAAISATYEPLATEAGTGQVVHWQVTQLGGWHG
jgi:hypothetical protein